MVAGPPLLAGCQSIGGPGASTYYDCDRSFRLKVDFLGNKAIVSVNDGPAVSLRETAVASGASYEGGGNRLITKGDEAIWTSLTREAPYKCQTVAVPR